MNKKILGITLGIIALCAGGVLIAIGVQQLWIIQKGKSPLTKAAIEKAVAESQKEFVLYEHPITKVRISYPRNWTVTQDKQDGGVAFAFYGGAVNLRLISDDFTNTQEQMTLERYSQILMAQGKERAAKQQVTIAPISDSSATLDGLPAHQWMYTVMISDVQGRGMQVWTLKNRRSYVLTYTAANELFDAFTPVVQQMIKSFVVE